jgi:hypothetical protein
MRLIATILLGCALAAPASAQRAGFYAVEGVGPDGTRYEGVVQMTPTGPQTWRLSWRVGGETISGVGVANGKALAVGYTQSRESGAVMYEVQADGSMLGIWTSGREGGLGRERLTPR